MHATQRYVGESTTARADLLFCINRNRAAPRAPRKQPSVIFYPQRLRGLPVTRDDRKLAELEKGLNQLRDDLNDLSKALNVNPRNTSLVIRRVNLMGRIVATQSSVEQLRGTLRHA